MAFAKYVVARKCSLCPKHDEGFQIGNCIIHFFVCQSCLSRLFRKLNREFKAPEKVEPHG